MPETYQLHYPDYARALYYALADDPFYQTLEASIQVPGGNSIADYRKQAMLAYLDYSMFEAERYGILYIPYDHAHGVSVWSVPLEPQREQERKDRKRQFIQSVMGESSLGCYTRIVSAMAANIVDQLDPACWYLSIVGILPQYQNRGLGAALIEPVLQRADVQGVDTYLETFTPRNVAFYRRLGYEVSAGFDEPETAAHYQVLTRKHN